MDDVLNRPLFRRRGARERLNDMAGIQGYQVGGGITADPSGAITRSMPGMTTIPVGRIPSPVQNMNLEPVVLNPGTSMAQEFLYDRNNGQVRMSDGSRLPPDAEAAISEALRRQELGSTSAGIASLKSENERLLSESEKAMSRNAGAAGTMLAQQAGIASQMFPEAKAEFLSALDRPVARNLESRGLTALEGPESVVSQMPPDQLDIFNSLSRAAETAVPPAPKAAPTGQEQRFPPAGPPATGQEQRFPPAPTGPVGPTKAAAALLPQAAGQPGKGPDFERTGRQTSLTPMQVAEGLNAPEPEVREKTAADFMADFMANAPKYEGADKSLMHAMVGFAIAAGDSPNAITNIAQGLQSGAQMFLQDKAAKAEFDRQLQLSAMQYGMTEVGKLAEEKRLLEREGRNGSFFVAGKDLELGGRTYTEGETVFVPNSVIWEGGLPEGLQTESMADAIAKNKAALQVALEEAKANNVISVSEFTKLNEDMNAAAESYESSRALRPLVEASIIRAADGSVTGVNASLVDWANQAANAVGVNLGSEYEDPAKFKKDMQNVANRMIQEILRESGRTVSDADRQRVEEMAGMINNMYAQVTKDPDVLVDSLQGILQVLDQNEQAALDQYRTITKNTAGLYAPNNQPLELSERATRVFGSEAPVIDMDELFTLDEKTGVWKPKVQ